MQMHAHYLEAQSISAGAHTWRAGAEEDFPYGRMLLLETREERQGLRMLMPPLHGPSMVNLRAPYPCSDNR
jgi:hypothetical protein